MCVQILLSQIDNRFEMLITLEYSEEKDEANVVIRYNGNGFDPLQTENELSLLLAKKATESIVYQAEPENTLYNRVSAEIR